MISIRRRKTFATAVLLFTGIALKASLTPRLSFEELVSRSEIIAQGRVIAEWSAWDTEHRYIWSHYRIQVTDAIRGSSASTVVVSEPGGTVGAVSQAVDGVNAWNPGDNVIVFLHRVPNGYLRTTGGVQGNARVSADGRVLLASGGAIVGTSGGTDLRQLSGLPLGEFRSRLRQAVQEHPLLRLTQ
jgi:hypothetical protein